MKEMEQAAENLEFEKAARLRDQLQGVEKIMTQQKAVLGSDGDEDVIAMARGVNQCCVQIFFVRGGKLVGRENYFLRGTDDSSRSEVLASFIKAGGAQCFRSAEQTGVGSRLSGAADSYCTGRTAKGVGTVSASAAHGVL